MSDKPEKTRLSDESIISETVAALISCKTKVQAADLLGIDDSTLYLRLKNHPEIMEAVNKIPKLALARLQSASLKAAGVLVDALDNRTQKLTAATEILDRSGVGKSKDVAVNTQVNISVPILGGKSVVQGDDSHQEDPQAV